MGLLVFLFTLFFFFYTTPLSSFLFYPFSLFPMHIYTNWLRRTQRRSVLFLGLLLWQPLQFTSCYLFTGVLSSSPDGLLFRIRYVFSLPFFLQLPSSRLFLIFFSFLKDRNGCQLIPIYDAGRSSFPPRPLTCLSPLQILHRCI